MPEQIIFNGRFLTAPSTGVQRVARELVSALDRGLASSRGERDWRLAHPPGARMDGLTAVKAEPLNGPPGQLWEQVAFGGLARRGMLVNLANTAPLMARNSIVMIHDAQVFDAPASYSAAFRAWYRFMLPRIGRASRRVLTVSRHSAKRLAAAGVVVDADRVGIIPNGVDHILRLAPAGDVISRHGLAGKPFLLGFASGQPHKNTRLLFDVAEADLAADMCVALIGNPPEGMALPPRIRMLGRVTDAELRALYEAAFAFLLPSKTEGFGLPAGEAMMCGAPVIVADAGALSEVWAGGALLASPDKPQDWVEAIRALAADPGKRDNLRKAGTAHAAGLTWTAAAGKLRVICEEAAPA